MLSALIPSEHSYPAVLLAKQPVHQRFVQPGPLVLRSALLKSPTPTADTIRTVSRRSKPSSRTALMGEQPNPWERLHPQDATSRNRGAKLSRPVNALGISPLFPRGSFFPLSDHLSIQSRRITMPDFRPCSACQPHSQAPLRHYTPRPDFHPG